jgi:hypothetical protein
MKQQKPLWPILIATVLSLLSLPLATLAAEDNARTAGGLTVYIGVLPAAIIQGRFDEPPEQLMHNGIPGSRHAYHLIAAVFDAESGEPITDAKVEAHVALYGLAGAKRQLEPMHIAEAMTYGNYFSMRRDGLYQITLSVTRAGATRPVVLEFTHELRTP